MRTRTKIVCTLGPAVNTYEKILELIDAGMNVARINFSHGTHEEHKKTIDLLKKARKERDVPLAIMLDTKGPEIRVGVLDKPIPVQRDDIRILGDPSFPIEPLEALKPLKKGDFVLFDDGYIGSEVVETSPLTIKFLNGGEIKSQKGVNMPHVDVPLPAMTERDIRDIRFGCAQDVDLIAASFIRSADHVREIKDLLLKEGKPEILILAKIENSLGVENFDSIVQIADGIMIARGDLGVELPIEEVPILQKMMIRKCVQASKSVITATQMLESMMHNPRPTRAEASDVANAVYDSTSAIMLSGETAVGKYPIETVKLMRRIVEAAEEDFSYQDFFYHQSRSPSHDISSSISLASVKTAYSSDATAIFTYTNSGLTARLISRNRPEMPILALTKNPKTYHQLSLSWGVIPIGPEQARNNKEALTILSDHALKNDYVQFGDLVVVTSGTPFGVTGTTNTMVVESIGEVLVRGDASEGLEISGEIAIVLTPDGYSTRLAKDKIVVLPKFTEEYIPILENARAVILQNYPEDEASEDHALEVAKEKGIPIIVRADEALRRLQDGLLVTLNPKRGTVHKQMSK